MTKTLDDATKASNPGGIRLSPAKLRILQPALYGRLSWIGWYWVDGKLMSRRSFWLTRIEEQLLFGDSRAAVVITTSPLLIAAYTDELDCVALLRFSDKFVSEYDLKPGSRLITVNTYEYHDGSYESDLLPGPAASGNYRNFSPFIADFLTDDLDRLAKRKATISEDEWRRTEELGQTYVGENYARPRDGRPCWVNVPAEQLPSNLRGIEPEQPEKPAPVTMLEVPKRIIYVIAFSALFLWGIMELQRNPRTGFFGLAVFGTMLVISIVHLIRLPRDLKRSVGIKEAYRFKDAYMWIGGLSVSFLVGAAGELVFTALNGFWPNFAIWSGTFVAELAFYPFRGGQMKKDYPTFTPWAIVSALLGLLALVFAHVFDWLEIRG